VTVTPPPSRSRSILLSSGCLVIGAAMAFGAKAILWLIAVISNAVYYHKYSAEYAAPAGHHLGYWAIFIPAVGGLVVGLMARYGSRAIQGHGIPEAMEQVLLNGSRIPPRILFLKPLSTSVVIGTGGPFGAEGVVIATGGALGSVAGQWLKLTPVERKTLLAAGAAAGLSACFACPISAVLLAVELLLFEFHPRSLIPVALASAAAAAVRIPLLGQGPMFETAPMAAASAASLLGYLALGAAAGLLAIFVVELVHRVETLFEHLPVHWIWKPALGGLGVGLVGLFEPRVLGPGYPDIETLLGGAASAGGAAKLGGLKLLAWVVGVGCSTSSGTLAPLLLIGSSAGRLCASVLPRLLDPRVAALAGMAAFFGGMSGAFLASVVLAFEAAYQVTVLMPLLAATAASYLVVRLLSQENIMTQKFVRQGIAVPPGLVASPLDLLHVAEAAAESATVLSAEQPVSEAARALDSSFTAELSLPVVDASSRFIGFITVRELARQHESARPLADLVDLTGAVVAENATLREAAERMLQLGVDRLAVLSYDEPQRLIGVVTQRDILEAHRHEERELEAPRSHKLRFAGGHSAPQKRPHKPA
jgi:H+/Cl- antiporter ClcA/CBS domain-containing protein